MGTINVSYSGSFGVNTTLDRFYVGDPTNNSIDVIDGVTDTDIGSIYLGPGVAPGPMAVDSTNNLIYVAASVPGGTTSLFVIQDGPDSVFWSSGAPAVASISATGVATALTQGQSTITANGGSVSGSTNLTVISAAVTNFVLTGMPSSITAGMPFNVTVTAEGPTGNTATGFTGTVHFSSSDGQAVLPPNSTLTNGVGIFSVTLRTAGNRTVTAEDTNNAIPSATSTINVTPAAATHFTVTALAPTRQATLS